MKALCSHGTNDIRCDTDDDPSIEDSRDVVIKVTSSAICGSDRHLMEGLMHEMHSVDVPGDEFMDEVGSSDHPLKNGDRCRSPYEAWRAGFATAVIDPSRACSASLLGGDIAIARGSPTRAASNPPRCRQTSNP